MGRREPYCGDKTFPIVDLLYKFASSRCKLYTTRTSIEAQKADYEDGTRGGVAVWMLNSLFAESSELKSWGSASRRAVERCVHAIGHGREAWQGLAG